MNDVSEPDEPQPKMSAAPDDGRMHSTAVQSMRVSASDGGVISFVLSFGGDALTAGLTGIHPHYTAWPSDPRRIA